MKIQEIVKNNLVIKLATLTADLDRQGKSLEISGKEQEVNQILQEIMQRVPWVIMGFSEELQKLWNANRSEMFEFIDERRHQVS